jgi:hypothetical protein
VQAARVETQHLQQMVATVPRPAAAVAAVESTRAMAMGVEELVEQSPGRTFTRPQAAQVEPLVVAPAQQAPPSLQV